MLFYLSPLIFTLKEAQIGLSFPRLIGVLVLPTAPEVPQSVAATQTVFCLILNYHSGKLQMLPSREIPQAAALCTWGRQAPQPAAGGPEGSNWASRCPCQSTKIFAIVHDPMIQNMRKKILTQDNNNCSVKADAGHYCSGFETSAWALLFVLLKKSYIWKIYTVMCYIFK